jgi:hypothetical protein
MRLYAARSWDLHREAIRVRDGLVWSAKVWRLGCRQFPHQHQPYRLRAPLQWGLWAVCNPN